MSTAAVVVAAVLGVLAVVFVARPFLRDSSSPSGPAAGDTTSGEGVERLRLAEDRDRALTALKELEFDHRTGKISDADYRELVGPLRREAAEALRALDAATGGTSPGPTGHAAAGPAPREEAAR